MAAPPAEPRGGSSVKVVFTGLMLVLLMAALDQTIVLHRAPTIVGDLGGLTHISWVVTAYLLAQTVVTPVYGWAPEQHADLAGLLTRPARELVREPAEHDVGAPA